MRARPGIAIGSSAFAFGIALAMADIYPFAIGHWLFAGGTAIHGAIGFSLRSARLRNLWLGYGFSALALSAAVHVWFWRFAFPKGVWYPEPPQILQRFLQVDGESALDALVSNWIIVALPALSLAFLAAAFLVGGPRSGASTNST